MSFTFFPIFYSYLKLGLRPGEFPWFYFLVLLPKVLFQKLQARPYFVDFFLIAPWICFMDRVASMHACAHFSPELVFGFIYLWSLVFLTWQAAPRGPVISKNKSLSCWVKADVHFLLHHLSTLPDHMRRPIFSQVDLLNQKAERICCVHTWILRINSKMPKWEGLCSGDRQDCYSASPQLLLPYL